MKRLTPLTQDEAQVDHNIVHLCAKGFWWCRVCRKITNLVSVRDAVDQEDYQGCCFCFTRNLKWHEPVLVDEPQRRRA